MDKKIIMVIIASFILIFCSSLAKAQVTLSVGDTVGFIERQDNQVSVSLSNPHDKIFTMQMDICDVDDYITCTSCELTERASGEDGQCLCREQENGCCRIILFKVGLTPMIEEGEGPILNLMYDVLPNVTIGECRELNLENVEVADENLIPLDATLSSGEVCFGSGIPTLSEWGLIIFMTIVMGTGVITLLRRKFDFRRLKSKASFY